MVKRLWMRTAALLLAGVCVEPAMGCRPDRPREAREVVPELKLEGVTFRVYREDALRASGEASGVGFRRDTTELHARELVATLLGAGPIPVRVNAPEGQGVASARTFLASGGVEAVRGDDVARTARARYEPAPGRDGVVRGDDPAVVSGRGYRLEGAGFTLDPAAGTIVLGGHPRLVTGSAEAR